MLPFPVVVALPLNSVSLNALIMRHPLSVPQTSFARQSPRSSPNAVSLTECRTIYPPSMIPISFRLAHCPSSFLCGSPSFVASVFNRRLLECVAAIPAATIRMEYQPWLWPLPEPCHSQCICRQTGLHVGLHAPPNHLTAIHIKDCRQIQPELPPVSRLPRSGL